MEIHDGHTPAWLSLSNQTPTPMAQWDHAALAALLPNRPTEVNRDQSIGPDLARVQEIVLVPVATRKDSLPAVQKQVDWKPLHVRLSTLSTQNKKNIL